MNTANKIYGGRDEDDDNGGVVELGWLFVCWTKEGRKGIGLSLELLNEVFQGMMESKEY